MDGGAAGVGRGASLSNESMGSFFRSYIREFLIDCTMSVKTEESCKRVCLLDMNFIVCV